MSRKRLKTFVATAMVGCLTACGQQPPKCSDDNTLSLVRQIMLEQLGGSKELTEKEIKDNLRIDFPRASAFDEGIKKYSCEAKLVVGGVYELPVTYASQLDDKSQHIVSVSGIRRGDVVAMQLAMVEGIRRGQVITKPAEALPTPKAAEQPVPIAAVHPEPAPAPSVETPQTTAQPTWSPSFDCGKASTFSEKAVCTDALLGKLDGALAENYKQMLSSNIGDGARSDLRATQRRWLIERNKCTDNQCLAGAYRKRIDEICDYPVISGIHPVCTSSDEVK